MEVVCAHTAKSLEGFCSDPEHHLTLSCVNCVTPCLNSNYKQCLTGAMFALSYKQCLTAAIFALNYKQCLTAAMFALNYNQCLTAAMFALDYKQSLTAAMFEFQSCLAGHCAA